MPLRVGLNGVGRIGKCLLRLLQDDPRVELVAINDVAPIETTSHLVRHDSIHGPFPHRCEVADGGLRLGDRTIPYTQTPEPAALSWSEHGVEVAVEATGRFARGELARGHLGGSVERTLVTAVCPGADATVVAGPHDPSTAPRRGVVATASCTTHAAAVPLALIDSWLGVAAAEMTTVHCTTGSQVTIDLPHRDLRRARASLLSMIPTTTSASRGLAEVFPHLADRLTCLAIRVPTATVSLVELVIQTASDLPAQEDLRQRLRDEAKGPYGRYLGISEEPLVSIDFRGDSHSSIVDLPLLASPGPRMLRLVAWYDNEWGYASRVADVLRSWAEERES
jgi:glyceraldehyde 3-phosphate dehydrogenase